MKALKPVGARLAREVSTSVYLIQLILSFAGKLAPTGSASQQ
jgi:hypothetical protein